MHFRASLQLSLYCVCDPQMTLIPSAHQVRVNPHWPASCRPPSCSRPAAGLDRRVWTPSRCSPFTGTHTSTMAPLNIQKQLFGAWRGGEGGAEREGLCVDTTGPLKKKDATKMSPRSDESWMERFCFGITWREEGRWRDNTVEEEKKKKKQKVRSNGRIVWSRRDTWCCWAPYGFHVEPHEREVAVSSESF